jgi:hypothetical protein
VLLKSSFPSHKKIYLEKFQTSSKSLFLVLAEATAQIISPITGRTTANVIKAIIPPESFVEVSSLLLLFLLTVPFEVEAAALEGVDEGGSDGAEGFDGAAGGGAVYVKQSNPE